MIKVIHFKKSTTSVYKGLAVVVLSALFMMSCSKENKLATHIPKDATAVFALDVKSLAYKSLDFKELLSVDHLKKVFADMDDSLVTAIKESGVDLLGKAYVFGKMESENNGYGVVAIGITDAGKFEAFLKKVNKDIAITKEGDYSVASPTEGSVVVWNGSEALVLVGRNDKDLVLKLATLKKEESLIANNESFKELESKGADIAGWMSFESLQSFVPQAPIGPMANVNLTGTFMSGTCNFEDGQVVVETKYYTNEEMSKKFNFTKANLNNEVAQALPGKSVVALISFALDMEKVYGYLESENLVAAMGEPATQMTGLTPKEALTLFSGDIAATVNGVSMKEVQRYDWSTGQEVAAQEPDFDFYAVVGIANKENAGKVLAKFVEQGMLTKTDNVYSFQDKMFVIDNGTTIGITASPAMKQLAVDGNGEKLNGDLSGLLTGNSSAMYVNLNNISPDFFTGSNLPFKEHLDNVGVDDVTVTASQPSNNVSAGKFVLKFKDKGQNSLLTITKIAKKYSEMIPTMSPSPLPVPSDSAAVTEEPVVAANE